MNRPFAEVIGDPIAHSKSPLIHKFWIGQLGLDVDYRGQGVAPEGLARYLHERRGNESWRGCNVTMPHKQVIAPLVDRLDPLAAKVGAVNTVVRESDGALVGYNTDVDGFLEPLRADLAGEHLFRMARICGTGGAARAIVTGLAREGFALVLAGRDPAKAARLLAELAPAADGFTPPLDHFATPTDFAFDDREGMLDLVVNASPLGMEGQDELAFDLSHAPPGSIVYDIVTVPARTALLRAAEARGFRTIDGLTMLIGQAAGAFKLFFDAEPPRHLDEQLRERLTG
ncbi:shikimate dehydrogenase family protein [Qipengyuania sp. CAU 1752]